MQRRIYRGIRKDGERRRGLTRHLISIGVALAVLCRPALPVWAQTAASPSPTPSASLSADDFEKVCGPVLSKPAPTHEVDLALYNQKLPICQGAAASHEAMKDQDLLWKIWAGVAAVCGLACGASFFGAGNQYICIGTNLAAGVTEGVVTEDFSAAMTGIMGAGTSFLINTAMGGAASGGSSGSSASGSGSGSGSNAQSGGNSRDIGACLSAGMAVLQAVNKHAGARSAEDSLNAAMAELSRLQSSSNAAPLPGTVRLGDSETTPDSAVAQGSTSLNDDVAVAEPDPEGSRTCSSTSSSAGESISCATALDDNLPGFVGNSRFPKEFERSAGQSLDDFLSGSRSGSAGDDISSAMSNLLTSSAQAALKAAADGLAESVSQSDPNISATAYRGGGARRNAGGGGGDDDFMGQMAGLMGKLLPGGKAPANDAGAKAVQAVMQTARSQPGRIEEDRGLSIFDRVKVRYLTLSQSQRILSEVDAKGEASSGSDSQRLPAGTKGGDGGGR